MHRFETPANRVRQRAVGHVGHLVALLPGNYTCVRNSCTGIKPMDPVKKNEYAAHLLSLIPESGKNEILRCESNFGKTLPTRAMN